jgi:hypothetical protein
MGAADQQNVGALFGYGRDVQFCRRLLHHFAVARQRQQTYTTKRKRVEVCCRLQRNGAGGRGAGEPLPLGLNLWMDS